MWSNKENSIQRLLIKQSYIPSSFFNTCHVTIYYKAIQGRVIRTNSVFKSGKSCLCIAKELLPALWHFNKTFLYKESVTNKCDEMSFLVKCAECCCCLTGNNFSHMHMRCRHRMERQPTTHGRSVRPGCPHT